MAYGELLCDGECGLPHPVGDLHDVGPGVHLCDDCHELTQINYSVPERWPRDDDGPTPPLGDPGEAGHEGTAD